MSTKSFLHEVMSLAWQFVRKNGFTMSEALKCAWANMKLKLQMKSKIVKFYFQKVDGSVREAYGTLNEKLMPAIAGTGKSSVRAKFLAMALGGIKTKSTVVRKLRDSEGNLTGEDELQVCESELAPNLQAMSVWLYHHDEDWRKIERKQDEDADIPTDIEHGINIDSWIKDKLK